MATIKATERAEISQRTDEMIKGLLLLNEKAVPQAAYRATNQTARQIRTKGTKVAGKRANVKDFHIRRKMHPKRQFSAKPFKNRLHARIWLGLENPTAISMFTKGGGKGKGKLNMAQINKQLKKKGGVRVPRRSGSEVISNGFIKKGERRSKDKRYDKYVKRKYGAGKNVLKGKHLQVMTRLGKTPYPLNVEKVEVKRHIEFGFRSVAKLYYQRGGRAAKELDRQLMLGLSKELGKLYGS